MFLNFRYDIVLTEGGVNVLISDDFVTMTEANQNFSKVARKIKKDGEVVICKNSKPKYIIIDYDVLKKIDTKNMSIKEIAKRLFYLEKNDG